MNTVDVIIPCRNAQEVVSRAIESANQPAVQRILCVDDRSTDDTRSAIERAAQSSSIPVVIVDSGAPGANGARNRALQESRSSYCQFLDADDELMPGKIESQLETMQGDEVDIVFGSFFRRWFDGETSNVSVRPEAWNALITSELGCTSSTLIRREAINAVGGWNEKIESSQEYELFFRLLQNDAVVRFDSHPLTIKHELATAISHTAPMARASQFVALRAEMRACLSARDELTEDISSLIDDTIHRSLRRMNDEVQDRISQLRSEHLPSDFSPAAPTLQARVYAGAYRRLGPRRAEAIRAAFERRQQ